MVQRKLVDHLDPGRIDRSDGRSILVHDHTDGMVVRLFAFRNLKDIVSFDGFDPDHYEIDERRVLQPQLEAAGYGDVEWFTTIDQRGEFRRMARAVGGSQLSFLGGEGKVFEFYYE